MDPTQEQPGPAPVTSPEGSPDPRRHALAIGFELARNATRARTLDELQFVLVNDTRALLPFDRSFLIVHFSGHTQLVAVNNQPKLEQKSDWVQRVDRMAQELKEVKQALVLFRETPPPQEIPPAATEALQGYIHYSECTCLMVIPLMVYDQVIGHLMLEFFQGATPSEVEAYTLLNMVPFFSSALAEKWVLGKDKGVFNGYFGAVAAQAPKSVVKRLGKRAIAAAIIVAIERVFRCRGRAGPEERGETIGEAGDCRCDHRGDRTGAHAADHHDGGGPSGNCT
jgi:hypothetical protein